MISQKNTAENYLILLGGAEDKKGEKLVLKTILEITKAQNVVIIPTASFYPHEVSQNYLEAFSKLGLRNIDIFDIRLEDEADREMYFEKIEHADLVYFSGGDQVKLVETLIKTKLLEQIRQRFLNKKLSIVGTSAGAAAAGNPMIYDGDYKGFNKGSVSSSIGFGFMKDITIDSHFISRGRTPRLIQFLLTGRSNKGIGLAEDTGVYISSDKKMTVFGTGMVTLVSIGKEHYSNYQEVNDGDLYTACNLNMSFLAPGSKFNLSSWSVVK